VRRPRRRRRRRQRRGQQHACMWAHVCGRADSARAAGRPQARAPHRARTGVVQLVARVRHGQAVDDLATAAAAETGHTSCARAHVCVWQWEACTRCNVLAFTQHSRPSIAPLHPQPPSAHTLL
jgi:hypothetical protein